jgi:hypothetical protein
MGTPFEELEYLSDFLPDEGESLVVSRRGGELVCQPLERDGGREGVSDGELYGRLVLANERLAGLAAVPVWSCLGACFALCAAFHELTGIGWSGWYVDAAIAFFSALGCSTWIAHRRRRLYRKSIGPMLEAQFRNRDLNRFALVGSIRQHSELRTLFDQVSAAESAS